MIDSHHGESCTSLPVIVTLLGVGVGAGSGSFGCKKQDVEE